MPDAARHAGASMATASRVLNGTSPISVAMRQKAEASVDAPDFLPSPSARTINSGRTLVRALVSPLDHALLARWLSALEEERAVP
ncbi:MAG: LacI family DNA-binding transcriptional regulator [Paracoccaceae bacterium]